MIKTILFLQKLTVGPYTEEVVLELGFEGWTVGPERQVVIEAGVRTCFLGWCSLFGHCTDNILWGYSGPEVEWAVYNLDRQAIVSGRVTYTAGSWLYERAGWRCNARVVSVLKHTYTLHMPPPKQQLPSQ